MAQWEYITLAGGDELYSALISVRLGTLGGDWQKTLESQTITFVGGSQAQYNSARTTPQIPLYPLGVSESAEHSVHNQYEAMFCVLKQSKRWIEAIEGDPWGTPLYSDRLPIAFNVTGVSQSISPQYANTKVSLSLSFAELD
jgi:hypothetical protein